TSPPSSRAPATYAAPLPRYVTDAFERYLARGTSPGASCAATATSAVTTSSWPRHGAASLTPPPLAPDPVRHPDSNHPGPVTYRRVEVLLVLGAALAVYLSRPPHRL